MERRIVIADAGGTKTDWVLVRDGSVISRVERRGLNVMQLSPTVLEAEFAGVIRALGPDATSLSAVYFYGAGCVPGRVAGQTEALLRKSFGTNWAHASSDMLGAARATLGHDAGIACILGTGSNTCLYDGQAIVRNVPPLGFILGDEGSGVSLGRRLVVELYRGILPENLRAHFEKHTGLTLSGIYEGVYRASNPREILASLVPYLAAFQESIADYRRLVADEFDCFITRNLSLYPESRNLPVGFTGGVASTFAGILTDTLGKHGMEPGPVIPRPIDNLTTYHLTTS